MGLFIVLYPDIKTAKDNRCFSTSRVDTEGWKKELKHIRRLLWSACVHAQQHLKNHLSQLKPHDPWIEIQNVFGTV